MQSGKGPLNWYNELMKPRLYLFVGYPGAGKTTIAQWIVERTGAVHIWADQERQEMFSHAALNPTETEQLYSKLNQETDELIGEGKSVIFDTNFNFYNDREHMRNIAQKHGADLVILWVTTPLELARERAVQLSDNKPTRLFGNMPISDFERIVGNLQPPRPEEQAIQIDGSNLKPELVYEALNI